MVTGSLSELDEETLKAVIGHFGGLRNLRMLVGASDFVVGDAQVRFSFKGCRRANKVVVQYEVGTDTYHFRIGKLNKQTWEFDTILDEYGVYNDQLMDMFEQATGLYLTLFPRR